MIKLDLAPIAFQPRTLKALPKEGQRLRAVACKAGELWQGTQRVQYRVGDTYLGVVAAVSEDGLIDIYTDEGLNLRIYSRDRAFEIKIIE
ncbi:MAG: hypothetical protein HGA19_16810 [Oscillochloris sp.]|nr:hypothetical protein [Oscillochloris sp.]